MTRKRSSSEANIEALYDEEVDNAEDTKVGGGALAAVEANLAAQLSKETRKATSFDLDAAMAKARPSFPGGIDVAPPDVPAPSDSPRAQRFFGVKKFGGAPPTRPAPPLWRRGLRVVFDLLLIAAFVALAAALFRR